MNGAAQHNNQPVFSIEKIYVKDISLEIPHSPRIFLERETPQIEVQLHSQAASVDEGLFEVVVMVTASAKIGEKIMFLIEVKQAGLFRIANVPEEELEPVLAVVCPNILFPYLREAVSDVSVRAGFAPMMLTPVNFDVLYQQQKQQQPTVTATTH